MDVHVCVCVCDFRLLRTMVRNNFGALSEMWFQTAPRPRLRLSQALPTLILPTDLFGPALSRTNLTPVQWHTVKVIAAAAIPCS